MQRHRRKVYESIMCERANNRLKLRDANNTSCSTQLKLTNFMDSSNVKYQECLLYGMIDSYQPLSPIQRDSFRKLTQSLNGKAPIHYKLFSCV